MIISIYESKKGDLLYHVVSEAIKSEYSILYTHPLILIVDEPLIWIRIALNGSILRNSRTSIYKQLLHNSYAKTFENLYLIDRDLDADPKRLRKAIVQKLIGNKQFQK